MFAAARALESAYAQAGYVLVRVALPPQRLVNGSRLRLVVIDGAIERVEISDAPVAVRGRILSLLEPLVGKTGLKLAELERRLLFAGDLPGVLIRSTLAPGSRDGATVLVIEVKHQIANAISSYDNSLPSALGRSQIGIGADFNSALGFGELVYLRANGDPIDGVNGLLSKYARNRILAAGFVAPLGSDGLSFNAEFTQARTTPLPTGGLATTDSFDRLSFRLRYAFLRSRDFNFSSQLVLDVQDERQTLLSSAAPLADDRLRVLRVANYADYLTPWGSSVSGEVTNSFGLNALGARTAVQAAASSVPLSRQGADAGFAKLDGSLTYAQTLAEHLSANLSAQGQTSYGASLERAEQIGIAGPGKLSAFDVGAFQGDSGFVLRGEFGAPFSLPQVFAGIGALATPYAFAADGKVFNAHPTALEAARISAGSFGAGLRLSGARAGSLSNVSLTLEYGRESRSDHKPDGDRFTLVASSKF